jgi:hypothetical protein
MGALADWAAGIAAPPPPPPPPPPAAPSPASAASLAPPDPPASAVDADYARLAVGGGMAAAFDADAHRLPPLASPATLLADVAAVLAVNDRPHILAALVAIRRGALHHAEEAVLPALGELVRLLLECLQSADRHVVLAALLALLDVVQEACDALLPFLHDARDETRSLLLLLLLKASAPAEGPGGGAIAAAADAVLRYVAERLHQPSVVRLLEPLAGDYSYPRLRAKAAALLVRASYASS